LQVGFHHFGDDVGERFAGFPFQASLDLSVVAAERNGLRIPVKVLVEPHVVPVVQVHASEGDLHHLLYRAREGEAWPATRDPALKATRTQCRAAHLGRVEVLQLPCAAVKADNRPGPRGTQRPILRPSLAQQDGPA